ncbi:GNAT family N-acetyltransferase [Pseudanabaena sp. PCC 6802]|uniref:GNAT family N-acetyltransferase n=1 Tax=Pseudanabaena sp. PCC 6802 TaxID=118173 RepID=UPI00034D16BA|nr:GNAT family N-acetyltransferase [Pseudanabaena sp. PCC 6802]
MTNAQKSSEILVRRVRTEDAAAVCQIHIDAVRQLCAPDYLPEYIEAWVGKLTPAIYERVIADWGETMFVAEQAGRIIGCSALSGNEVRAVYVNPLHARQGVGTLLMRFLEKEAVARCIPKLRLTASLNAELFYQKHGYKVVERSWHILPCGTKIPCIFMEKNLR